MFCSTLFFDLTYNSKYITYLLEVIKFSYGPNHTNHTNVTQNISKDHTMLLIETVK